MMQDALVEFAFCPGCGSADFAPLIDDVRPNLPQVPGSYSFSRCRSCDLGFANPRPSPTALVALYDLLPGGQHYSEGARPKLPPRFSFANVIDPSYRAILARLPQGEILDVGCGQGAMLRMIVDSGRIGSGVDFSPSAQEAGRRLQLDIRSVDLNTFEPELARYDGIVLRHVLEHIEDPVGLLERLRGGLRPGGSIVIEVPNLDGFSRFAFGRAWNGWDTPFHVNQFTPRALSAALNRAGFKSVRTTTFGVVDEARRSWGRRVGREGRYDGLRIAALPVYKTLGVFGFGGSLLATAVAR